MAFEKHNFIDGQTVITADIMNQIEDELINIRKKLWETLYPVGTIYMSVDDTSPSELIGGTWIAWGNGRVPVGVDAANEEFKEVEKTGGSKALQEHTHSTPNHSHSIKNEVKSLIGSIANMAVQSKGMDVSVSGIFKRRGTSEKRGYAVNSVSNTNDGVKLDASHGHTITQTASGGGTTGKTGTGNSGNLQPYITCYMFKRVA